MPDFAYYQTYLQTGLRETERYLLSNQLFWLLNIAPPIGEPAYPNLTSGGLLLHCAIARSLADNPSEKTTLQKIEMEMDGIRMRWRVAWEKKVAWEYESRLRQWGNVLKEIRIDPEDNVPYYPYEVRLRVLLKLLGAETNTIEQGLVEHLEGLDRLLKALFAPGDFIWQPQLADAFPPDEYWYLWGLPKEP